LPKAKPGTYIPEGIAIQKSDVWYLVYEPKAVPNSAQIHQQTASETTPVTNPVTNDTKSSNVVKSQSLKLMGLLNCLNEDNYKTILNQLIDKLKTNITNIQDIDGIVSQFFQKAVNDKKWSHIYARICNDIYKHFATPQPEGEANTFSSKFRSQLLKLCYSSLQEDFERSIKLQKEQNNPEKEIDEKKLRDRMMAIMKFIGELYNHNLIKERTIHKVIFCCLFPTYCGDKLTDEGLELFCELMDTAGKKLDRPEAKKYMTPYFQQVGLLSQIYYNTTRVRFKLQNLLDLHKNKWER